MKKISVSVSSLLSRLCAGTLVLLGFGCSSEEPEEEILCMYGSPIGTFEVKGKVVDAEGNPVSDAKIYVAEPNRPSTSWYVSKGETDGAGQFDLEGTAGPSLRLKVVCKPDDPKLEADSTEVEARYGYDADHKKGEWYFGHANIGVDFTLKEKKAGE